jgi:hypothetical protein
VWISSVKDAFLLLLAAGLPAFCGMSLSFPESTQCPWPLV